jgi:hypothetical protein
MRVMAFADTPVFDSREALTAELESARSVSCILELQGTWSTETRWGLRWKILQVKVYEEEQGEHTGPHGMEEDAACENTDRSTTDARDAFLFL